MYLPQKTSKKLGRKNTIKHKKVTPQDFLTTPGTRPSQKNLKIQFVIVIYLFN
jgi:hypothetical protein